MAVLLMAGLSAPSGRLLLWVGSQCRAGADESPLAAEVHLSGTVFSDMTAHFCLQVVVALHAVSKFMLARQ